MGMRVERMIRWQSSRVAVTQVTALAVTKLDGTAKGGVILSIADEFKIPIKYIGLGEKMEQLQVFNREVFVEMLFNK